MSNELIRPIDPDTAKAISETAMTTGKAVDAATRTGSYFASILGSLPHNLVGMLDDSVAQKRFKRLVEMFDERREILRNRKIENVTDPSMSIMLPLLSAALDEDREHLKELWSRLLANASDPSRKDQVRVSLIETLKKFDPLDALVLEIMGAASGQMQPNVRDYVSGRLKLGNLDEIYMSFDNLIALDCLGKGSDRQNPHMAPKGRLLLKAVAV